MANFWRIGGECGILAARMRHAAIEEIESFQQSCRRKKCESVMKAPGGLLRSDRSGRLDEDIAGIESLIHLHDGDARFAVPCQDGGLHRGSAAVTWQQRRVDVDAAQPRERQERLAQELTVGGDNNYVGPQLCQSGECFRRANLSRLMNRQVEIACGNLDWRCAQFHLPAGGAVRLREDCLHFMGATRDQRL